eukprot:m.108116 g.108116  ORF g.108116 m.108116 type:complete len:222 (+) comp27848_c0_seq1:117-782(+)
MSNIPIPELVYFNGPGRANLTRLAFHVGGVEFKDTRIANWPEVKADPTSVPAQLFGCMPAIKHGEHLVGESLATALYAAELGLWSKGVLGESAAEIAKNRATEMMVAATNESLRQVMYACLFGSDESKAAGLAALPGKATPILAALERALDRKKTAGPYFFSQKGPSLADLAVFDNVNSTFPGLTKLGVGIAEYPKLTALVAAVAENEAIKAYKADTGFLV